MQKKSPQIIFILIAFSLFLLPVSLADGPPIPNPTTTGPPVTNPPDPSVAGGLALTEANFNFLVKQNATLMTKVDVLTAKQSKFITHSQLTSAKHDIYEAVEFNTQPLKTSFPLGVLMLSLFFFVLFIIGSTEFVKAFTERRNRYKMKCPECSSFIKRLELPDGVIYKCNCGMVFGELESTTDGGD